VEVFNPDHDNPKKNENKDQIIFNELKPKDRFYEE